MVNLINGKFRSLEKKREIIDYFSPKLGDLNLDTDYSSDIKNNYWFCGFTDALAIFKIKLLTKPRIKIYLRIYQNNDFLLKLINENFKGDLGYWAEIYSYHYSSSSFTTCKKLIEYFDNYHLLSNKYLYFLNWRKIYQLIQEKEHLSEEGLSKIRKMNEPYDNDNYNFFLKGELDLDDLQE